MIMVANAKIMLVEGCQNSWWWWAAVNWKIRWVYSSRNYVV